MSYSLYLLFVISILLCVVIVFINIFNKKNNHMKLYCEGMRNENAGQYKLALDNYENALNEVLKLRLEKKFGAKVTQRIKILRSTIEYEKNFHAIYEA